MIPTVLMLMLAGTAAPTDNPATKSRLWPACLVQSARSYAPSKEAAETIAEVVMADCASYERGARSELLVLLMGAYQHIPGGIAQMVASAEAAADRRMDDMRRQLRGKVIGIVIAERAKAASQPPAP